MNRCALIALLWLVSGQLMAQSTSQDVRATVQETVGIEKETQAKRDAWAKEQADLEARYRTSKANVAYLKERIAAQENASRVLDESIAELDRRMVESKRLEASLGDTLNMITLRLDRFVTRDLPFLPQERSQRLSSLKEELARPDATGAEKLRRLLEALQVEAEYGKTAEVSAEKITVAGSARDTIFVDVLRVGRVSMFWRTPDGQRAGTFDRGTLTWTELPKGYLNVIGRAIEMANRTRPVTLLALPLGRVQP